MALFEVRRFMGDDDDDSVQEDKRSRAASILQILQAEAKAKRLSQTKSPPTQSPLVAQAENEDLAINKFNKSAEEVESADVSTDQVDQHIKKEHRNADGHTKVIHDCTKKNKRKVKERSSVDHENNVANQLEIIDKIIKENKSNITDFSLNEDESLLTSSINYSTEFHEHKERNKEDGDKQEDENQFTKIHKHKKRKHSHSLTHEESESSPELKDSEVTDSKKHRKKKKKNKHNKEENLAESLDNSDVHDDLNSVNASVEQSKHSSEKKRKRKSKSVSIKQSDNVEGGEPSPSDSTHNFDPAGDDTGDIQNDDMKEELNELPDEITGETELLSNDKPGEIGGFTVIGNVKKTKVEIVKRVLPDWLANPSVISADLKKIKIPVGDMPGLDKDLVERLLHNNINHFFPVQMQVIPSLLDSISTGFHIGRAGYRPSDICVSAPTGSGKTLAFVLPVVQALRHRVTCEVRALVVLPVRDLATQVFKVFQTYAEGSDLKVGLLVGQKSFSIEQQSVVKKRLRGYQSMYDIIVATPGRLVDHINKTEGFDLTHLRFLVIDEADRVMGEIKQDWLIQVESAVYSKNSDRPMPGPLTAASCSNMEMPLQKLLYSATLSSNPEKLQQLNLFQPKLFTSVVMATDKRKEPQEKPEGTSEAVEEDSGQTGDKSDSLVRGEFVGKFTTPAGLSEFYIEVTAAEKPLIILYLLHHLKFRNVLCFTSSLEATHRLFWIIKLVGGIEVKEFSSARHATQRERILKQFKAGKIDIIICSDAMARGMDIDNVKYVISYDPPQFIKTYVHRIGRTARAGKVGSAITLIQDKEFFHFKKMIRESGKSAIKAMKIMKKSLMPLIPNFEQALSELPDVLKREKKTS